MHIQPDEGISLQFGAKIPGPTLKIGKVEMNFNYKDYFGASPQTGYETLIYDCMVQDPTLFNRADNVEAGWRVVKPIQEVWHSNKPNDFPNYAAGTWGPASATELIERDGRQWRFTQERMILTGDIGGTKTRLAVFDETQESFTPQFEQVFQSSHYPSLEDIIKPYLQNNSLSINSVCIGFAGPVKNGQAIATNLPWVISSDSLAACLKVTNVWIINDLEANAYGIEILAPCDFQALNIGIPDSKGNVGLISAGTGLGEAGMVWDGERLKPFATEALMQILLPKMKFRWNYCVICKVALVMSVGKE